MEIKTIIKRDGSQVAYRQDAITNAIHKAFLEQNEGSLEEANRLAGLVYEHMCTNTSRWQLPDVEMVQNIVEQVLMEEDYFNTARAYILYRNKRNQERSRNIFKHRRALKPYEYPELLEYVDSIRHSYWVHTEFNFTSDIQDYKTNISPHEQEVIKRTMLAIAQIEVAVKTFWADIVKTMPKPEVGAVGITFAESEVRHADAYAHLLEIMGFNDEFADLDAVPVFKERMDYLDRVLSLSRTQNKEDYVQSVLLFSLFIEHVSLFSQFLIMMAFNKHKNLFKGISNAVEATSKEEQIHGLFGIEIINLVQEERPEWFDEDFYATVRALSTDALKAEEGIIDWIYEHGELDFLPRAQVVEFIKQRFNNSLAGIGTERLFEVDEQLVAETDWFEEEVIATKHVDFFNKRSVNYSKRTQSITTDDLF